jgi:carboxyl-terminal processing protease
MESIKYNKMRLILITGLCFFNLQLYAANKSDLPELTDLQRFSTVMEHIKNYYVNPISDGKLLDDAIRGMLAGLDPHSSYLDVEEFAELKAHTSGKFGGIGIELTVDDGAIKIVTALDDTPAFKAGLKANDMIIKIDETIMRGLSLKDCSNMIQGKPGSIVTLTIISPNSNEPKVVKITREIINVQSVKAKILEKNYLYVRIAQFQQNTTNELKQAIQNIKGNDLKGLILDLRNNPGGILEESAQTVSLFLNSNGLKHNGLIVYTKGRANQQITEKAKDKDITKGIHIVILVNEGSASAAEIVAGAMQDHKRAVIMGEKTFGKGSVQTVIPLKDQRGLKLTTALYYTPAGRLIQATGITPDITVSNVAINPSNETTISLKEAGLNKHLTNTTVPLTPVPKSENTNLLYSDYQLHEALQLLKALQIKTATE